MKLVFAYDEDKDIDCLLKFGGGSQYDPKKTKTYEALLRYTDDLSDIEKVREFVRSTIAAKEIVPAEAIQRLQQNWDRVETQFIERAEKIFGVSISEQVMAYATVTGRYPYHIDEHCFFVSLFKESANHIAMHELLHFYTWERFKDYVLKDKITGDDYGDIKESLTVLLNLEFADIQDPRFTDGGYPQHAEMRAEISNLWKQHRDIGKVFEEVAAAKSNAKSF